MAKIPQTTIELLPAGWYPAKVLIVQPVDSEYGPQLEWRFEVTSPNGDKSERRAWSGMKFAPGTKLFGWVEKLAGSSIPKTMELDTDELSGLECDVRVEVKASQQGQQVNRVTELAVADSMTKKAASKAVGLFRKGTVTDLAVQEEGAA